ncbi:MAG: hypothetical protein HPZ91_05650 [Lentisphaeria bacterium]|nr:hypothetical protein [Lentisphaeria bacterium]
MKILRLVCFVCFSFVLLLQAGSENLLTRRDGAGRLPDWHGNPGNVRAAPDGTLTIRIDGPGSVSCRLRMEPEWKYLLLEMRMKTEELVPGEKSWQNGRLAMRFGDAKNKEIGEWPNVFGFSGDTPSTHCSRVYEIPAGAAVLSLAPSNFGKSGSVEFTELKLLPLKDLAGLNKDAVPPFETTPEKLWDYQGAYHLETPTRELFSLNGLWQFFPVAGGSGERTIPADGSGWCWFKVPGAWNADQQIHVSPFREKAPDPAKLNSAWYRRTVAVPADWKQKRIFLEITMLQTCAQVFVDGKNAGEFYYPGGRLELTDKLTPGKKQELALLVSATPDQSASSVFMAPGRLISVKSELANRGIVGDVALEAVSAGGSITDAHIITSFRNKKITVDAGLESLPPGRYFLEADIRDGETIVKSFHSAPFAVSAEDGLKRRRFETEWAAPKLWDTDEPQNLYLADVRLKKADGTLVDALYPQEFGFREFWIDGRNFYLNGSVIHLRSLCYDGMKQSAGLSFRERMQFMSDRARQDGFNHLIGYNYDFSPGVIGYLDSFHTETSRKGILTTLTMPHAKDFDWALDTPEQRNRYLGYSEFLIRRFQNLPGVVLYGMSHNATGYFGDQNPLKIDGRYSPDKAFEESGSIYALRRRQAELAASLVKSLDATRPVYHHECGNLGDVYTLNCYLNWAPRQERSDWLEHWEKNGTKPLMIVEWGMPHIASWSSFRGPAFIWRYPAVQCVWIDEFNSAILGEEAYRLEKGKQQLAELQEKLCTGNKPVRYGQLNRANGVSDVHRIREYMTSDNFRALRARGLSGLLPWDQGTLWTRTSPWPRSTAYPERFENLKQPGIVPDAVRPGNEAIKGLNETWEPSLTGRGGLPYLQELIGWIGGKAGDFSEKGHNFRPGETVNKQLIILNDTRRERSVECTWSVPELDLKKNVSRKTGPGSRNDVPVVFAIPADFKGKTVALNAEFRFPDGRTMTDSFEINVIHDTELKLKSTIGLFDPAGYAAPLFKQLGIPYRTVKNQNDLKGVDLLVIGRGGLKNFPLRLRSPLESGLRLLVMEQEYPELLRLGLRGNIHGLREVFSLDPAFPALRDWRGRSSSTPEYLATPALETHDPTWDWNGFNNTRVWRAGNRGVVNGVLLEKPSTGNFLPLMQGGFDLQYAPLLELTEGKGRVLFSQLEISGRTENDPEALEILKQILRRLDRAENMAERKVFYSGDRRGEELLRELGIVFAPMPEKISPDSLLVLGPGTAIPEQMRSAVDSGLSVLALGLGEAELKPFLPAGETVTKGRFYSDYVTGLRSIPEFAGISNADLHWRLALQMDSFAPEGVGGRALRLWRSGRGKVVALQVVPWMFDPKEFQLRTTVRRNTFLLSRLLHNLGAESKKGSFAVFDGDFVNGTVLALDRNWLGREDPGKTGRENNFWKPEFRPGKEWRKTKVGCTFESQFKDLADYDGYFWYRLKFDVPGPLHAGSVYGIQAGAVDDESWIWLNGRFLGEVTARTHPSDYWSAERSYQVQGSMLKERDNTLVILCNDLRMQGGVKNIPTLKTAPAFRFYADEPVSSDDPYRYYRW